MPLNAKQEALIRAHLDLDQLQRELETDTTTVLHDAYAAADTVLRRHSDRMTTARRSLKDAYQITREHDPGESAYFFARIFELLDTQSDRQSFAREFRSTRIGRIQHRS